jgi:hypothetical protein
MLLYQQDYDEVLTKIDEYKKIKLSELSKDKIINEMMNNKKIT